MHRKAAMAMMALLAGGCLILTSLPASAQQGQHDGKGQSHGSSKAGAPRGNSSAGAPRGNFRSSAPRATRSAAPRNARRATPNVSRAVTPRSVRKSTPRANRAGTPRANRTFTPRTVHKNTPRATRTAAPKVDAPERRAKNTATAANLRGTHIRGAARATIGGHKYSVWRGSHRFRHGGNWRTFGALSALSIIVIGSSDYYPYAYISAPEAYCDGFTEDGCQLSWHDVETVEGDTVEQCVAYCPWR
jgi:hypothetical protein